MQEQENVDQVHHEPSPVTLLSSPDIWEVLDICDEYDGLMLDLVPSALRKQAIEAFCGRDVFRLMCLVSSDQYLNFFFENEGTLMRHGMYEEALVKAYSGTKLNNRDYSTAALERAFKRANRRKLRAAGDPLPDGGTFTIYRGVAGTGKHRRIQGLSWTGSLSAACWFAMRYANYLPNPAVYQATICRQDVFCYVEDRGEQEFVCRPRKYKYLPMDADQMRALAEQHRKPKE